MSLASKEAVLLWRQPDGLWRWAWGLYDENGKQQKSLVSNEAFEEQKKAVSSAREAYPGVEILEADSDRPPPPARPRRVTVVGLVAAVAGALVVRRWRRAPGERTGERTGR